MKILKSQIVKIKPGKNLKILNPVNIYGASLVIIVLWVLLQKFKKM